MHRWFFANEREECVPKTEPEDLKSDVEQAKVQEEVITYTDWPFCVMVKKPLEGNESVGVTGNCDELGNWDPKSIVLLERSPAECGDDLKSYKFTSVIRIPRNIDIEYRYCIVATDPILEVNIIRFWEVHLKPRIIRTCHNLLKKCDVFGQQDLETNDLHVDRGWTTGETFIQFKIFNAPFIWQKQTPRLLYVHIQPEYAMELSECNQTSMETVRLTTVSIYNRRSVTDTVQNTLLAFTEVANLKHSGKLHFQAPSGARCGHEDLQLFHCSIYDPISTLYRLNIYTFANKAAHDEPPYHYGYGFIYPRQLVNSEGSLRIKITCASTHRPLIEMNVKYLIIRPLDAINCDFKLSYARYWRHGHPVMEIGHRGTGPTYQLDNDVYRENTLFAFRRALVSHADMIELDVVLTRDNQVVVFHDHVLKFLPNCAKTIEKISETNDVFVFPYEHFNRNKMLAMGGMKRQDHVLMPIQCLTYEELKHAGVLRYASNSGCNLNCEQFLADQEPFTLLSDLFNSELSGLPEKLGFSIELKWPQQDSSRRWEHNSCKPAFDRNFYVDTILELIFRLAGKRRIFLSSFDADICTLIRFKQNYYPVLMQITDVDLPVQYLDVRVSNLDNALFFAHSMEFFGLSVHCSVITQHPLILGQIRELHLQVLIWGTANNLESVRSRFKRYGAIGLIYDHIDQRDQKGEKMGELICFIDSYATRGTICSLQYMERINKCRREI